MGQKLLIYCKSGFLFALKNSKDLLIQLFHGRVYLNLEEIYHSIFLEMFFDFFFFGFGDDILCHLIINTPQP